MRTRQCWRYSLYVLVAVVGLCPTAEATEQVHRFRHADREGIQAWDQLLRQDSDLARDARRHRFVPSRDLTALRVDLDGDGRPELALYADLMAYCGSAGCMVRILTQRHGRWVLACETYAEAGNGLIVDTTRTTGWRNLRGTYRVTWREDTARPAGVACVEGETVPRSEQNRPNRSPR